MRGDDNYRWGDDSRDARDLDRWLTHNPADDRDPEEEAAPVDPWEVLRRLRARYLLDATAGEDEISGADAITELCEIREELDRALDAAPRTPAA